MVIYLCLLISIHTLKGGNLMDNILEIRSLEGDVTELVKDDFIHNHLPAIYDRTLNLKGAILDNDISLLTNQDFKQLMDFIELLKTDTFAITTNNGKDTLRVFKKTKKIHENWSVLIETAKSYGGTFNYETFNFEDSHMGFIFIDDIVHHFIK